MYHNTQNYNDGYLSGESSYIVDAMANLRLSTEGRPHRKIPLQQLDDELRNLHETKGISLTKMRRVIKELGICLTNCFRYGSEDKLRKALKNNRKLFINRNFAKEFKYVKSCLIQIY